MTAEQFAYWMQGFAELSGDEPPTPAQWKSMREHLALVFTKVTPPADVTRPYVPPFDLSKLPMQPTWEPGRLPHMYEVTCTTIQNDTSAFLTC
jgi:hypothetical protein